MPRYAIIGVEGQHDQAFVTKLLRGMGLNNYGGDVGNLDPFWQPFVPVYPKAGRLYVRLDMPAIVFNADISIAVYAATGSNLRTSFPATFEANPQFKTDIAAFGIIADSDDQTPDQVAQAYATAYRQHFFQFPNIAGVIDYSPIQTGIFVLPDNTAQGTLEDILLECADIVYPNLKIGAASYVNGIDRSVLVQNDLNELGAPAGIKKAQIGCVSNILRPGKTTQTSIQDNRWIDHRTLALPKVDELRKFLRLLLSI